MSEKAIGCSVMGCNEPASPWAGIQDSSGRWRPICSKEKHPQVTEIIEYDTDEEDA
jgi:hypothetical protein